MIMFLNFFLFWDYFLGSTRFYLFFSFEYEKKNKIKMDSKSLKEL